ncbi:transporter [Flavobacterium kingsejongi]|uniref:Uncharacterized protein n=1 Tax=Flavobacterium kingsejongi TaxID=1678728 RepID=A0A2S1LR11_9FLAO|nr:transporter [Flavobacterium kingsejongi]AWG26128.1 hypothetical protein FK004_13265 [Flavobacterium kingsejongi]
MKQHLILLFYLLGGTVLFAQDEDFATDRPGLSDTPDLVVKDTWQIATGFDISKYNHYGIYQLSENTLKYGINSFLEARMDFGLQYDPERKTYGIYGPSFGAKALLLHQKKALPKTAFIIEYYPPIFKATQRTSGLAAEFCFSYDLSDASSLYYNIGTNWQDIAKKPIVNNLLGYSYTFNPKLGAFVEFYLYQQPHMELNYVSDIGITYQLEKKLQLDLSAGRDIVKPQGNYFCSGGITCNF